MTKNYWVELPLTERGKRQPIDNLVRQLHEAGFLARRVRDFCTDASEKEFYLDTFATDSIVNNMIVCRIDSTLVYRELCRFAERHPDFFHRLPDDPKQKQGRDYPYLQYLLTGIYHSGAKAIRATPSVRCSTENGWEYHTDWKDIDSTLRPYQLKAKEDILRAWSSSQHVMLQMPTGTGKTRLFVSLIADIRKHTPDSGVLIVTHRKELVEQISRSLSTHYHLLHGILSGNGSKDVRADILVVSIQTFVARMRRCDVPDAKVAVPANHAKVDYIIVDEAHHALAPSYQKLWKVYPEARILGVTATPCRLRKSSFAALFDTLVESQSVQDFIRDGYLAKYRYYTVSAKRAIIRSVNRLTRFNADGDYLIRDLDACCNKKEEISFLLNCYESFATGKKGIVYAVNQSHGQRIAERFRERGISALSIDCNTPSEERIRVLEDFREGKLKILVNVELFTEGFDCPSIGFVLLARPTRSLALYLQQVGRALRPSPDGEDVIILDVAGLYGRFGLPDRKREWAMLFKGEKSKKENYNRPLGYEGEADGNLLVDVSRKRIMDSANVEATPHEWSVYHIMDKLNIINKYGNAILKKYLLQDLKRDADGNYSAWLGMREYGCKEGHSIRFTPSLTLIPDNTFEVNGCRFYAFPLQGTSNRREYTLSLELESRRYTKVYSWNSEWVVMVSDNRIYHYTRPDLYPQAQECKVSLINDEPYLFTQDFIVGRNCSSNFYRRLPHGLYLYYRREGKEDVLYNAQLEPLWRGQKIEVLNEGMVLHDTTNQSRKVEYLDVLFGNVNV